MVTTIFIKKNGWSTTRKVHVHLQMYLIWHCLNLKLHSQTSKPFGIIDDREPRLQNLGLRHVTEEFLEDLNPPFGGNNFIITSNSTQMSINFDLSLDPRSSQKNRESEIENWGSEIKFWGTGNFGHSLFQYLKVPMSSLLFLGSCRDMATN